MRKGIVVLLAVTMILSSTACGNKNDDRDNSTSKDASHAETEETEEKSSVSSSEDSVKIEDIDWNVKPGVIDGTDALIFSYTNNTTFVITDVEMEFTQREGITDDDLKVFDELKADCGWTDEDVKKNYLLGYNRKFADPGETVSESPCVINGTYILANKIEQYEIMEPSKVSIAYIGSDNKMHIMYYDFHTNESNYQSQSGRELKEWSDSKISSLLPEPDLKVVQVSSDDEEHFFFKAFGVSVDEFKAYVDSCKDKGFTNVGHEAETSSYRASNADGYEANVKYTAVEETMSVSIEKNAEVTEKPENDNSESSSANENGIRPEFKETMDSYEAFFDEYCEFMKKYSETDDTKNMLSDYTEYMTKYADTMSKMSELGNEELSTEELAYYAEVSARISKKLLEVTQ